MDRKIELSPEERKLLREMLKERMASLREEIRHTDTPDFKDELKRSKLELRRVLTKVEEMGPLSELHPKPKKTPVLRISLTAPQR